MRSWKLLHRMWIWGPVLAYLGLIFYLSGMSSVPWNITYPDYLMHAVEYFGLATLLARALNDGLRKPVQARVLLLSFTLCAVYAITDEVHQMFVPNRLADYRDVISDVVGAGAGLILLRSAQGFFLRRASA